ncbi:unnamed protein product [Polarella glacialis]|uniref:Uncharacterized protein n=1 Tax=Polarella glacialis TaxID=89957 RepID=A0A813J262_POLGL|nr:unnamed protein product [Polarella glacialis]
MRVQQRVKILPGVECKFTATVAGSFKLGQGDGIEFVYGLGTLGPESQSYSESHDNFWSYNEKKVIFNSTPYFTVKNQPIQDVATAEMDLCLAIWTVKEMYIDSIKFVNIATGENQLQNSGFDVASKGPFIFIPLTWTINSPGEGLGSGGVVSKQVVPPLRVWLGGVAGPKLPLRLVVALLLLRLLVDTHLANLRQHHVLRQRLLRGAGRQAIAPSSSSGSPMAATCACFR